MKQIQYDRVQLKVFHTRQEMGWTAAKEAARTIQKLLEEKEEINCIFAAAPSQNDFLENLILEPNVEWQRIHAYHMDEYVGFGIGHPNSFNEFLNRSIFSKVPFKSVHLINGANDPTEEAECYGKQLDAISVDIVFLGIGENGHIAFNDPGVADFHDNQTVKIVALDPLCRQQQVNDGCFPTLDDVPKEALTVTVPKLASARVHFCIVPTKKKQNAVYRSLTGPIEEKCPGSVLRKCNEVYMYIDEACYWGSWTIKQYALEDL